MGTRRTLQALLEFDVKGTDELHELSDELRNVAKAGDEAKRGGKAASDSMGDLERRLRKIVAGGALLTIGKQMLDFGKASVIAASDVEEMQSKFNTVFKELAGSTTQELQVFADAANRSVYDLQGFAATLQDTFVPLGFARDEAADMSIQLVKLAEDLASFNNLNSADVVRDLQSALVGNTETLRKYGVVASQAAIDAEAYNSGIWNGEDAITAQQKAQAILNLTIAGTVDAQGDAIRTSDSYANVAKGTEAAITDLKVAIGQGLIPVMTDLQSQTGETAGELAGLIFIKNDLARAVDAGIISQGEFLNLQAEAALTGKTLAGVTEDIREELAALDAKTQESNINQEKATIITSELAAADAVLLSKLQELNPVVRGSAESMGLLNSAMDVATGSLSLGAKQIAAIREELGEARPEISSFHEVWGHGITEPVSRANAHLEKLLSHLQSLPSRKDVNVNASVTGLDALERAAAITESLGSGSAFDKGGKGGASSSVGDPTGAKFAGGVSDFIVPPGFPNDSFLVGLTSGETVNVTPAGETTNNNNSVSIVQNINGGGLNVAAQARDGVMEALAATGLKGFG